MKKNPAQDITGESTLKRNSDFLRRSLVSHVTTPTPPSSSESGFESARETVRTLLATLSPTGWPVSKCSPTDPKSALLSHELAVFRKTLASIMNAAEQEVITRDEADAVINFLAERFVARRFNDVFTSISTPHVGGWFCVAHRSAAHELP